MRKPKNERIKTIVLFLLVILSVVQIGIHLNQQTQGLPFSFLSSFFSGGQNPPPVKIDDVKENYFLPTDVTVTKNSATQYVFSQSNPNYQKIWNDVRKNYLPVLLSTKPAKTFQKDKWESLLNEACTRIDFPVPYPKSVLSWFLGITNAISQSFSGIESIAIQPQENVNDTVNTLYVYDGSMVYMYLVDIGANMQPKQFYRELPDTLTQNAYMSALGQVFPWYNTEDPNIPIYVDEDFSQSFQTINAKIPERIILSPGTTTNFESVRQSILLNLKDSLASWHGEDNTAVFSDLDNVYKLDSHGVLSYQYLPQNSNDPGDIKTALGNAISFIEPRKNLTGDARIILSDIKRESNYYTFDFDYVLDGNLIHVTDIKDVNNKTAYAIQIKATGKRVLDCKWIIREFKGNNDQKDYSVSFTNLINMIQEKDPTLYSNLYNSGNSAVNQDNELKFKTIGIGYSFDAGEDSDEPLAPCWLFETTRQSYKLRLQLKGGD